jgi:hypothetical protein
MKQLIIIFEFLFLTFTINAQITLEGTLTTSTAISWFNTNSKGIMFYQLPDTITNQIKLYNEDFSIYKTVTINRPVGYTMSVTSFSEQLFNSNSSIEFICTFSKPSLITSYMSTAKIMLYDDNAILLKDFGSYNYYQSIYSYIVSNDTLNKLIITGYSIMSVTPLKCQQFNEIYSLPGSMPNSISELKMSNIQSAFPNPSNTIINLTYALEKGQTSTMKIYKTNGQLIEQKQIDSSFDRILLNVNSYKPGVYFYEYNGISNKFIVN